MATPSPEISGRSNPEQGFNVAHICRWILAAVAICYALLAGLHTVRDFDLGWQLATGRWILQHRHIPSTDVFSYTAAGQPWIYPVLSGISFYLAYLAGGYALLSWLGAITAAGAIALLIRRDRLIPLALGVIAVPLIANRTEPRAEMFTTILFAAFLNLLWRHHRSGRPRLWLLPVLMVGWVNLHLGFIAGLALCGAYVMLEVLELPFPSRRQAAVERLRRAWPWLALTGAATAINPWGPWIYGALVRQARAQSLHSAWVVEWENIHPSLASLHQAVDWRDPQSCFWWLILIAAIGACIGIWRMRFGAAGLLIVSAYLAVQHVRWQALFACVEVVVGADLLPEFTLRADLRHRAQQASPVGGLALFATATLIVLTCATTGLAGIRCWDLVSNPYYLRSTQLSLFGAGISWWYPERAAAFIEREKLPGKVFNSYNLGGYLTWRLPEYPDYIDGRAIPFGAQLFFRAYELSVAPPDSPLWQREAETRGINTIIVPLSRYAGMTLFPQLHAFCGSQLWRPVYLDEVSAVFVRRSPQTAALADQLQIDCDKAQVGPAADAALAGSPSFRQRAEQFNTLANAGGVLYSLERYPEALASLDRAQAIYGDNASVHFLRALVLEEIGRAAEAEAEFRTSLRLEPSDETWFDLGLFYMAQRRYEDAAELFRRSAETSTRPHEMWMMLGQAYLQLHQPQPALEALDKAVESSPYSSDGESLGASFLSLIATARAKAWYQLGDTAQAVTFQEEAVKLAPRDAKLWLGLADLYDAEGRSTLAGQARQRAKEMSGQ